MTNTVCPQAMAALLVGFCAVLMVSCAGESAKHVAGANGQPGAPAVARLADPVTHKNLAVYLVIGPSTLKGDYLTLDEAMKQNAVRVHETDNVNELAVENWGVLPVFIQSGDIVKGGKQDRTIATDFVLPPKSGKVPVDAFCVEHGRWQKRGGESAAYFSSSMNQVTGRQLKLASNSNYSGGGQQDVWDQVSSNQAKLRGNLNREVAASTSPSSLQLTLEDKNVREAVEKYVKALRDAPDGKTDVIGYAAVINGKLNCADVYGSGKLFAKAWPRVLESLAAEAAAEMTPGATFKPLPPDQVHAALRAAEQGTKKQRQFAGGASVTTVESHDSVLFECRTAGEAGYLRQSILAVEPADRAARRSPQPSQQANPVVNDNVQQR